MPGESFTSSLLVLVRPSVLLSSVGLLVWLLSVLSFGSLFFLDSNSFFLSSQASQSFGQLSFLVGQLIDSSLCQPPLLQSSQPSWLLVSLLISQSSSILFLFVNHLLIACCVACSPHFATCLLSVGQSSLLVFDQDCVLAFLIWECSSVLLWSVVSMVGLLISLLVWLPSLVSHLSPVSFYFRWSVFSLGIEPPTFGV